MNGIAKEAVLNGYGAFVRRIENPRYMDGICARSQMNWELSYIGKNAKGLVTKSGVVKRNGVKFNITDKGAVKPASFKAFVLGKFALKKVKSMLDDINLAYSNSQAKTEGKAKLDVEPRWIYRVDNSAEQVFPSI